MFLMPTRWDFSLSPFPLLQSSACAQFCLWRQDFMQTESCHRMEQKVGAPNPNAILHWRNRITDELMRRPVSADVDNPSDCSSGFTCRSSSNPPISDKYQWLIQILTALRHFWKQMSPLQRERSDWQDLFFPCAFPSLSFDKRKTEQLIFKAPNSFQHLTRRCEKWTQLNMLGKPQWGIARTLFGHCPNSDCTPPPALKRALWGTFFPGRFEQICQITVLTVHKCTKHPGKP